MKHSLKISLILIGLFFVSQVFGLVIINQYIDHEKIEIGVSENVTFGDLPLNITRPEIEEGISFAYIIAAVIIATILLLFLLRFSTVLWKLWYFLAVWLCLGVALAAFINQIWALFLAGLLAVYKVFRPRIIIHNLTELLIYGGLAAIFVPIINTTSALLLLLFISGYDWIAVYKTKHMIKLAKAQTKMKVFAGLFIPYKIGKMKGKGKVKTVKVKTAVLGGGDLGFPLIFAGVIMKGLMLVNSVWVGFLKALIVPVFASIALFYLLMKAEKNKFYPAMPFVSVGCLVGWIVILLIG